MDSSGPAHLDMFDVYRRYCGNSLKFINIPFPPLLVLPSLVISCSVLCSLLAPALVCNLLCVVWYFLSVEFVFWVFDDTCVGHNMLYVGLFSLLLEVGKKKRFWVQIFGYRHI